jgi:hypothetical protein
MVKYGSSKINFFRKARRGCSSFISRRTSSVDSSSDGVKINTTVKYCFNRVNFTIKFCTTKKSINLDLEHAIIDRIEYGNTKFSADKRETFLTLKNVALKQHELNIVSTELTSPLNSAPLKATFLLNLA